MDIRIWILAAVVGYLVGSFSAARAVTRIFAPGQEIKGIRMEFPGSEARFESEVISATTVRHHLGNKYGCLTSLLDILKAAIPALLFRIWHQDSYYYLAAAGFATVGHIWPLYHRFKGGRGMSPILGGMLVMDWLGVIITQLVGGIAGLVSKKLIIIVGSGFALMIPWTWFRSKSWQELVYLVAMNILFWIAIIPEAKEIKKIQQDIGLDQFIQAEHNRMFAQGEDQTASIPPLTDLKSWWQKLFGKKD
jgi:glycerol-3-phosphate acyltransferase PlsY